MIQCVFDAFNQSFFYFCPILVFALAAYEDNEMFEFGNQE